MSEPISRPGPLSDGESSNSPTSSHRCRSDGDVIDLSNVPWRAVPVDGKYSLQPLKLDAEE